MTTAEKYVTAAYCVVFAVVLLYVVIIALKLQRMEREVDELAGSAVGKAAGARPEDRDAVGAAGLEENRRRG
jgi:CcmD family protein